jgi:hypothetical protein
MRCCAARLPVREGSFPTWSRGSARGGSIERQRSGVQRRGCAGHVSGKRRHRELKRDVLLAVLAANAGSLRALHMHHLCYGPVPINCGLGITLEGLLGAAPLLQGATGRLDVDAAEFCWDAAARLLRAEAPFAPLRLQELDVHFQHPLGGGGGDDDDGDDQLGGLEHIGPFAAALTDAAHQPELWSIGICSADTQRQEVLDALVDAALARQLAGLSFIDCTPPAAAPLARLLVSGVLEQLSCRWTFQRCVLFGFQERCVSETRAHPLPEPRSCHFCALRARMRRPRHGAGGVLSVVAPGAVEGRYSSQHSFPW